MTAGGSVVVPADGCEWPFGEVAELVLAKLFR